MTHDMKRREFLRRAAISAAGAGLAGTAFPLRASGAWRAAEPELNEKVVLNVNLFGGNDGLNTVVPLLQYNRYRDLRPVLGLDQSRVLALAGTTDFGFNPGMTGLRDLYAQNKVAVIHGVGAPPDTSGLFDHEQSQLLFQTAVPNGATQTIRTGWLGRYVDSTTPGTVSSGINLGGGDLVVSGQAQSPLALSSSGTIELSISADFTLRMAQYERLMSLAYPESPVGEANRLARRRGLDQAAVLSAAMSSYVPMVTYPEDNYFAMTLRTAAALIWANLGVRAISVGTGGYDTHSEQNSGHTATDLGYHDDLLKTVSDAILAFQQDIEAHGLGSRVVTLVSSEFGRRPEQNADIGTDHGYASVVLAVGAPVHGGMYGGWPGLNEPDLVLDGNLRMTTDLRSVYSTVVARHLNGDPVAVLGGTFPQLGFL